MPRIIKLIGQNQTIRKSAKENIDLLTMGINGCVAIVIKDKEGNISFTHADRLIDCSFIKDELAQLNKDYTIDVIRKEPAQGELAEMVNNYIIKNFPDIKKFKR